MIGSLSFGDGASKVGTTQHLGPHYVMSQLLFYLPPVLLFPYCPRVIELGGITHVWYLNLPFRIGKVSLSSFQFTLRSIWLGYL